MVCSLLISLIGGCVVEICFKMCSNMIQWLFKW